MPYIGIDITSKKHNCCIIFEKDEILAPIFTFKNDSKGYDILLQTIRNLCYHFAKVKVGLEATGHYGTNLISFLRGLNIDPTIFNSLQVDLYRKASRLRKTKTDKADAKFITQIFLQAETHRDVSVTAVILLYLILLVSLLQINRRNLRH